MAYTLGELARRIGGEVAGDADRVVRSIRTLDDATAGDLAFFTHPAYLDRARRSRAGAILVPRRMPELAQDQLISARASVALAELLELFHPRRSVAAGIHPTAVVHASAEVAPSAHVGPYAVVGSASRVAAGAVVHAHVVIGEECSIGARAVLHPHVVLYDRVAIGEGSVVHAGAVVGADGFGYAFDGRVHRKVPQVGGVEIGGDVEIGALSAIDRATLGATRVGDGTKIDNLVQVGHNVEIGRNAILCGLVGVAGSTRIGDGAVLGGQSGAAGHLEIGAGAQIAGASAVLQSVEGGKSYAGYPAIPLAIWRRQQGWLKRLADFARRLRRIESKLGIGSGEGEDRDDESGMG